MGVHLISRYILPRRPITYQSYWKKTLPPACSVCGTALKTKRSRRGVFLSNRNERFDKGFAFRALQTIENILRLLSTLAVHLTFNHAKKYELALGYNASRQMVEHIHPLVLSTLEMLIERNNPPVAAPSGSPTDEGQQGSEVE